MTGFSMENPSSVSLTTMSRTAAEGAPCYPAMPDQPEQVPRFRRADEQTCQAREYDSFDKLAVHVEYLLARCDLQAEEIKEKVRAYPSLPADLRPAALRELKDNVKALETGVVRHGSDASVFRNTEMRGLTHELFGASLPVSTNATTAPLMITASLITGRLDERPVRAQHQAIRRSPNLLQGRDRYG